MLNEINSKIGLRKLDFFNEQVNTTDFLQA
jgi:hypothetical protein